MDSWKTETFRKSVENKINVSLKSYDLLRSNYGAEVEVQIFNRSHTKEEYLGYLAIFLKNIRHMVLIDPTWLQNKLDEILSRSPPKLRRILPASYLAKLNTEKLKNQSQNTKQNILE